MKDNGKCALKIKEAIEVTILLVIGAFLLSLTNTNNTGAQVAESDIQNNITIGDNINKTLENIFNITSSSQEEIQIAQANDREFKTTNRSNTERIKPIELPIGVIKYKSIDEIEISRDMDLTERCGVSRDDFIDFMENLKVDTSGFFGRNAGIIYDLCKEYELNEIFFCGLMAGESGWNIASGHRSTHNYISMMSGGHLTEFGSDAEGVEAAAKLLHTKYLSEGGSFYRGKTLSSVQKIFCPNSSTWVGLIYTCMSQMFK